jgi:hypothetical protein
MKKRHAHTSWRAVSVGIAGLIFGYVVALSMHGTVSFAGAVKCPYHHEVSQPS